jgi:4-diphosphocytidyl-2-C-methyl-D-erythritol kinase
MIRERAPAKVNLVLHVGTPRQDGMHPLCSLFARVDLADEVAVEPAGSDVVSCPGVRGSNLAERALAAFREVAPDGAPPLAVRIEKRVPVAAGLGGGSGDAAAVLRAANEVAGRPLAGGGGRRPPPPPLGADVPSQIDPRHALVTGVGDEVEPVSLPPMALVLVPSRRGLRTADVYAELDRRGGGRERLEPDRLRALASSPLLELAGAVENDLQPAALALRPELDGPLAALRDRGALAAAISGSGPTAFGLFEGLGQARAAAEAIENALAVAMEAGA